MLNRKYRNYITEQTAPNDSDLKKIFDELSLFIDRFKRLTPEQQLKMTELIPGKNEINGSRFFDKAESIIKSLIDVDGYSPESQEYLKNNIGELSDKIIEFRDILKKYPLNYNTSFKTFFDQTPFNQAYGIDASTTPSAPPEEPSAPSEEPSSPSEEPSAPSEEPSAPSRSTNDSVSKEAFRQFMIGDYDPNSRVDRAKMALVIAALDKFKQEKGREYDPSKDKAEMQPIMNNTYSSTEYQGAKKGQMPSSGSTGADSSSQKTSGTPKVKFAGTEQTLYYDMGGGRYAPASEDQLGDPKVQLYAKNPKKGQGEYLKPNYVKVRREGSSARPQSQFGGALGSASNLFGDIGNTLAGKNREKRTDKQQSKKGSSNYERNPKGVDAFIK